MRKIRELAFIGMFVAMEIILSRFISLMPSTVSKVSLSFIAFASAGYLFGTKFSMTTALVADLLGATLFPQGTYFIGFSLSAIFTGYMFGQLKKYNKPYEIVIILITISTITGLMNTLWLTIMFKSAYMPLLLGRIPGILTNLALRIVIVIPLVNRLKRTEIFNEN